MSKLKNNGLSLENLTRNFEEIEPSLTYQEAMDEAYRCLYCYDAPCITACPTSIDVPKFIKKIASGNLKGSAITIMEANPVGASCARVCPTEELCEGACVLNNTTHPIKIGNLQRYATDWAIKNKASLFNAGKRNGKKVAIVGGGPAGLSAARELGRLGYSVTIYESEEKAGGLNTYGIVSFRLPQDISLWEVEQVEKLGVEIKTNTRVGKDVSVDALMENYDFIILAIGMGSVPNLDIEGEKLAGVYDGIEFVRNTKVGMITDDLLGKKVAVIGAGNTAIDAATCSIRKGASNVKIVYRRTQNEMTAYDFEYEFAKQDGVEFRWLTQPTRIIGNKDGRVAKLECIRMQLGEVDKDGRRRPVPIEGSEFTIEVDAIIKANGQSRYVDLIDAFGLAHEGGVIKVNSESFQTSNSKVFAVGDAIFAKGEWDAIVVRAAQQGRDAAYAIHKQHITE